jgi:hypothetical protein
MNHCQKAIFPELTFKISVMLITWSIAGKMLAFQIKSSIILPGRESYASCISVSEMLVFSRED